MLFSLEALLAMAIYLYNASMTHVLFDQIIRVAENVYEGTKSSGVLKNNINKMQLVVDRKLNSLKLEDSPIPFRSFFIASYPFHHSLHPI